MSTEYGNEYVSESDRIAVLNEWHVRRLSLILDNQSTTYMIVLTACAKAARAIDSKQLIMTALGDLDRQWGLYERVGRDIAETLQDVINEAHQPNYFANDLVVRWLRETTDLGSTSFHMALGRNYADALRDALSARLDALEEQDAQDAAVERENGYLESGWAR